MKEHENLNSPIKKIHRPVSAPLSSETNTQIHKSGKKYSEGIKSKKAPQTQQQFGGG
jgi:hypothetical protein